MEIEIKENLLKQKKQIDSNFLRAIDENKSIISEIYLLINCYQKRGKDFEFDELLKEITHDAFASIYFCLQGFYRQSYISLRCILEMGISLFQFKDNNYKYLLWKNNKRDIIWSEFNKENEGILIDKYWELFLKGNFKTLKDFQVKYNKDICENILKMCKVILSLLITGTSIRFSNHSDEFTNRVDVLLKEYEVI